jgi:hypothetical protein
VNVRPEFTKEGTSEFKAWRERLNTDGGIMISNHPGILDVPLLMQALNRSDLKIVVNERFYNDTKEMPVHDLFIHAQKSGLSEVRGALREMDEHIRNGGLLLIFPTGRVTTDDVKVEFASGLRHLISRLDDKDLVYSFHIDRETQSKAGNTLTLNSSILSDFIGFPELANNGNDEMRHIKIDEACSDASEWKSIIQGSTKKDANKALTDHYLETFGISKSEFERLIVSS